MSDLGFTKSDLFSITAAKQAELAATARGLLGSDGYQSVGDKPLTLRTRDVSRALVEAAFTLHHCYWYDLLWWLRCMCLMPIPVQSDTPAA